MTTHQKKKSDREMRPTRLNRERVLLAAVEMADRDGVESVSMRNLADDLGVVPMALYKHVANKDELLDAMLNQILSELEPLADVGIDWRPAVRRRILETRQALLGHRWTRAVIETRTSRPPAALEYLNSIAHIFLSGGLTPDLVHHAMHAIGSRVWGFTQDVFDSADPDATQPSPDEIAVLVARLPHLAAVAAAVSHDSKSVVGPGCDDQFEFEFALDLLLDGIEARHAQQWTSRQRSQQRKRTRKVTPSLPS